ncbi:MAG: DUF4411 family protein [Firmicutes bacterium]|nr:DUF4411 family protein [Bacillota bacterium]
MDKEFILDSNIFILCHRQRYPFEMAPAFWRQLTGKGGQRVILLDKVKDEIYRNDDELSDWLKGNEDFFQIKKVSESEVIRCYSDIISFIKESTQYRETAKAEFASVADSWICAYGMAYGNVIVTNEKYEPDIRKRIKIPNVCHEFNLEYIGLLEFMRELDIRFD